MFSTYTVTPINCQFYLFVNSISHYFLKPYHFFFLIKTFEWQMDGLFYLLIEPSSITLTSKIAHKIKQLFYSCTNRTMIVSTEPNILFFFSKLRYKNVNIYVNKHINKWKQNWENGNGRYKTSNKCCTLTLN